MHARLGPHVASSSAEVGPVDVASLPNASVEELTVHVPSPPCVPLVSMGGRLVDAITLLSASVAELEAPVSPPLLESFLAVPAQCQQLCRPPSWILLSRKGIFMLSQRTKGFWRLHLVLV